MSDTGCAVIVEPRPHKALKFVIETALLHLPPDWPIQLFHGTQNEEFVRRELLPLIESKRLVLHKMPVVNLTSTQYSQMLLGSDFWNRCLGEHILIFQTDSTFLPTSPHKLTDFLQWDFIGGPCWHRGGLNGGFSLRKKTSSLAAVKALTLEHRRLCNAGQLNEDIYFCDYFRKHPMYRLAPINEAQKFSVEGLYYAKPLAVHKPWGYQDKIGLKQYRLLLESNPIIQELLKLQDKPLPVPPTRTASVPRLQSSRHRHKARMRQGSVRKISQKVNQARGVFVKRKRVIK
jgi:hypothetical protein